MKKIIDLTLDEERALYEIFDSEVINCKFDGVLDGESALKECNNLVVDNCYFNLRYPLWHNDKLILKYSDLTINCRAALWYSNDIKISDCKLHVVKALRECKNVLIDNVDIISSEFGWKTNNLQISNTTINSEYAFFESNNILIDNITFNGKYSFQYTENVTIENATFNTKDAFWHAKNVVIKNSYIKGEYLAWYAKNITFINCKIEGTQPFCYVDGLKIINCEMVNTDLAFERSIVEADIIGHIDSIKNPVFGYINVDSVGNIILDLDKNKLNCKINVKTKKNIA